MVSVHSASGAAALIEGLGAHSRRKAGFREGGALWVIDRCRGTVGCRHQSRRGHWPGRHRLTASVTNERRGNREREVGMANGSGAGGRALREAADGYFWFPLLFIICVVARSGEKGVKKRRRGQSRESKGASERIQPERGTGQPSVTSQARLQNCSVLCFLQFVVN